MDVTGPHTRDYLDLLSVYDMNLNNDVTVDIIVQTRRREVDWRCQSRALDGSMAVEEAPGGTSVAAEQPWMG